MHHTFSGFSNYAIFEEIRHQKHYPSCPTWHFRRVYHPIKNQDFRRSRKIVLMNVKICSNEPTQLKNAFEPLRKKIFLFYWTAFYDMYGLLAYGYPRNS